MQYILEDKVGSLLQISTRVLKHCVTCYMKELT
jgi:hypothetical protein